MLSKNLDQKRTVNVLSSLCSQDNAAEQFAQSMVRVDESFKVSAGHAGNRIDDRPLRQKSRSLSHKTLSSILSTVVHCEPVYLIWG